MIQHVGHTAGISVLADPLTRTTTGEAVTFWLVGGVALVSAVLVVASARVVYSALSLALAMLSLAVLYFVQDAPFLGVVQIVVYTGAVMMLFLFVMMLIGVDSASAMVETLRGQRFGAAVAGTAFGILIIAGIGNITVGFAGLPGPAAEGFAAGVHGADSGGNVEGLAALIFTRYLWAFELTGALLLTAVLAAMVLAHRERLVPRPTQRELSIRRFQRGEHVTPLPAPGVYARHNALDVAGVLPDGTFSELSVSDILQHRWVGASGDAVRSSDQPHPEAEGRNGQ